MVLSQRYQRVAVTDNEDEKRTRRKRRAEAAEVIATKIQALVWVVVGGFVVYHTNMPYVFLQDPTVNRFWLNIAAATFSVNTILCFYLTIWLPYFARIDIDWNIYCPRVIPTMTTVGLICAFALIRGLWPVWGLLTPLILAITFMACIMSLHFVPWPF